MQTRHETDAVNPFERAPVAAQAKGDFSTMGAAQATIAAIFQGESERLLKAAYRLVHRIPGGDPENIVADAVMRVMGAWNTITDVEHCRKLLSVVTRRLALNVIRDSREIVNVTDKQVDPNTLPDSGIIDSTINMLFEHCADDTERYILQLYLEPGNGTFESVSVATRSTTGKWLTCSWTVREVQALFKRLRDRIGASLNAEARKMLRQPMTKGTLPGHHWTRHKLLHSTLMIHFGPRPLTVDELVTHVLCNLVPCPVSRLDDSGKWVTSITHVISTRYLSNY